MTPQAPQGQPPRGGFFRQIHLLSRDKLSSHSDQMSCAASSEPSSPPTTASTGEMKAHSRRQRNPEVIAASAFMQKLNLKYISRLWEAITENCMLGVSSARTEGRSDEDHEEIHVKDFLRLAGQLLPNCSESDSQYLELLFGKVDRESRGSVRTTDIATALVLICSEDPIEKLQTLFRVFDSDADSCLTPEQIFDMYESIKLNDITRTQERLRADSVFDGELAKQEAKRLYQLTMELLKAEQQERREPAGHLSQEENDFVIFDEFKLVFNDRGAGPFLLENLIPGSFSLAWILQKVKDPAIPDTGRIGLDDKDFAVEVKRRVVDAYQRGEPFLKLREKKGKKGRAVRNMQNNFATSGTRSSDEGVSHGGAANGHDAGPITPRVPDSLPQIASMRSMRPGGRPGAPAAQGAGAQVTSNAGAASNERGRLDSGVEETKAAEQSDDSDEDDDVPHAHAGAQVARGGGGHAHCSHAHHGHGKQAGAVHRGSITTPAKAALFADVPLLDQDLPIPFLSMNNSHAKLFRALTLDEKTQQAYLREKKHVNRVMGYRCLVCDIDHDFKLQKAATSADRR